jgi:hypothetical protein
MYLSFPVISIAAGLVEAGGENELADGSAVMNA